MIWAKEFVVLNKSIHDRASFDCGEAELDEFIKDYASRHMEANISTTMVLPASEALANGKYPICAFYTITPSSIERENLPKSLREKLPYYPVPVFLIAQMAVHSHCKGQGLGKITLIKALEYLWDINKSFKAYAVIVDCINEGVKTFYAKYGFEILYSERERIRMFLPMQTVGVLFQ